MTYFRISLLLPIVLVLLISCGGSSPTGNSEDNKGNTPTTVAGIINNEAGEPIEGAEITINGKTVTTNKYGTFMIKNTTVSENSCYIICKKKGYFTGSRTEPTVAGGITEFRLTLQSNTPTFTIDAAAGGKITIGGYEIVIPSSSLATSNGTPYNGTAKVAAKFTFSVPIDGLKSASFSGEIIGKRLDGTVMQLLTFGVLQIRATDETGNELKFAEGKTATVTYGIPYLLRKRANTFVPLWCFDESLGIWKEDGSSLKTADSYSGKISRLGTWACALPEETTVLKGRVECGGTGASGISVYIGPRTVISDSNGNFSCRVPINTELEARIEAGANYGLRLNSTQIPKLSKDQEYTINLKLFECPAYVSGTIVDCNNNPTAGEAYVAFSGGGYGIGFTTTGRFKTLVPDGTIATVSAISDAGTLVFATRTGSIMNGEVDSVRYITSCTKENIPQNFDLNAVPGRDYGSYPYSNETHGTLFSPDGSMLAFNGTNYYSRAYVSFHETESGWNHANFESYDTSSSLGARAVNFTDDGKLVLIHWADSAYIMDIPQRKVIKVFGNISKAYKKSEYSWVINEVRMLPDGSAIVSRNYNSPSTCSLYSLENKSKIKDFTFKEAGEWILAGTRGSTHLIFLSQLSGSRVRIIYWDILSDSKSSDITLPNATYDNTFMKGNCFSPDFSIIALGDVQNTTINFYNSQNGKRINAVPFTYPDNGKIPLFGYFGCSNDSTFTMTGTGNTPTIFSMTDGKRVRSLWTQGNTEVWLSYTYSNNSKYIAAIGHHSNYSLSGYVRCWKVKE